MGDLRTKRTFKLLKDSLFELLSKKSLEEIKVNDICNLAMIHRTTFYSHFTDKYDLLEYCIKQVESEITNKISINSYTTIKEFYTNMIMNLLQYISNNKKIFKAILKRNEDATFISMFHHACVGYIYDMLKKEENNGIIHKEPIEIISEFYAGAVMSTITHWIKSNSKLTEEELCNHIISLIFEHSHHS